MNYTIGQIADVLGVPALGDLHLRIDRVAEPSAAGPDALALAMHPKYADDLYGSAARAAILWEGADWRSFQLEAAIFFPRPRFALAAITQLMDAGPDIAPGVHRSAEIDPTSRVAEGAAIGPFVVIGKGANIGRNARIAAHAVIGTDARIGHDVLILEGAKIGPRVHIGDRFIAKPGAVIGADGFSFVTPEKSAVEGVRETLNSQVEAQAQSFERIHSLGSVRIGDDVEVGANSAIDRGTIRDTVIGSGTKIDNLVQIGHNVAIGRDCLLCGHAGVAGSSVLGDRVVVGGAASIADHLTIGNDAIIAGKSGVASNVPSGRAMMGYPAMPIDQNVEAYKALRRLPRLMKTIVKLGNELRSAKERA